MSSTPEDARLEILFAERISHLAVLYDRFANALDPFAPERDQAETISEKEVVMLYDLLPKPKPDLRTFKKAIILRCRRRLRASDRPSSA